MSLELHKALSASCGHDQLVRRTVAKTFSFKLIHLCSAVSAITLLRNKEKARLVCIQMRLGFLQFVDDEGLEPLPAASTGD